MNKRNSVTGHVDSSMWNHLKCGDCGEWFAIEGALKQSHFFCPHCGIKNDLQVVVNNKLPVYLVKQAD